MTEIYTFFYKSPIGILKICANHTHLLSIKMVFKEGIGTKICSPIALCINQLKEYFSGKRTKFDLPLKIIGTQFEKSVWMQLAKIPHGKVSSYKALAKKIGKPRAFRAVGNANSKNKFPIVLPCHRVITSDGKLGGYAYGPSVKTKLLTQELGPLTWPLFISE